MRLHDPQGFATADRAWPEVVSAVIDRGAEAWSRNGRTKELTGVGLRFDPAPSDPLFLLNGSRSASAQYAAAELLWYFSGSRSGEMIASYAPSYRRFLSSNANAHGAYGPRLMGQLEQVLSFISKSPETRQAVVTLFNGYDDLPEIATNKAVDIPCTLSIQFLLRRGKLNMVVTMRSNDVWLGMPYDVFCFRCIQLTAAERVNAQPGWYQHNAGSLHLYERDWARAKTAAWNPGDHCRVSVEVPPDCLTKMTMAVTAEEEMRRCPEGALEIARDHQRFLRPQSLPAQCLALCATRWVKNVDDASQLCFDFGVSSAILNGVIARERKRREVLPLTSKTEPALREEER